MQVKLSGQPRQADKLDDTTGHGTFVSDVLAGKSADGRHVGVAPGAKIYAINVAGDDGVSTSDIINGLTWVLANKALRNIRVVNLSLAETVPSSYMTSALDQAVEKVWQAGIVVVTTSGNLGPDTVYYAPGNDPFVITVGASDSNDTVDGRRLRGQLLVLRRHRRRLPQAGDHGHRPAHRLEHPRRLDCSTTRLRPRTTSSPAT